MAIVTRDSLQAMLNNPSQQYVTAVVGRALVALMHRQTESERQTNATAIDNGVGFSGADGRSGTLTAKSFLKHGTLQDWQLARWTAPTRTGFARLTKYAKQLNEIAEAKASSRV